MIRLVALLLMIAFAIPAAGAEVAIRSGEHADFSRMVLYFGRKQDWRLGRTAKGYRLTTGSGPNEFDTSQVFEFMPRTRVLSVRESAGGLDLEVACACHADAFEYRADILVIDIKDGEPPPDSRFEQPLPGQPRIGGRGGTGALLTLPVTFSAQAFTPAPLTGHASPPSAGPLPQTAPAASSGRAGASDMATESGKAVHEPPAQDDAAALRAALGEGLGRAIAQGLATPTEAATVGTEAKAGAAAGIAVRSGFDIAAGAGVYDPAEATCLAGALFDVAAWGGEGSPLAVLERARASFLDDIDRPSEAAVLALARAYAHLGFGAEAIQVLAAFSAPPEAATPIRAIALQLDDPGRSGPQSLRNQVGCDTPAALWALLATPDGAVAAAEINVPAVQRALSALPLLLRRQVAPAVSERLRAAGLAAEAEAARATVSRATEWLGPDMQLETARADADEAEPALLDAMAKTAARPGAEALLAQAEILARLARDHAPVDAKLRHAVEAQIHESKGTPESSALVDAYVAALAANAGYDNALALLARLRSSDFAASYHLAGGTDRVMNALLADPSDGAFLVEARGFAEGPLFDLLSADIAARVAERMVALGFMSEAEDYSASGAAATQSVRQVALAAKARREGRPAEALARLAGLSQPEAIRMKADALSDLGAFGEAAEVYLELGEKEQAAEAYWRAGRWEAARRLTEVAQRQEIAARMLEAGDALAGAAEPLASDGTPAAVGDPGQSGAAAALPPSGSPAAGGVPRLADAQAWIDESAALRAFAENVLADGPEPR